MVFSRLLLLFFLYAFLGWCCEVAFAAIKCGEFINRGFLNGPVCPIYGFGVIGVALALSPIEDQLWLLYLGSVVLTTGIEFITGWALEKLFHTRWWDYSDSPMNIMGYVCVPFSMLWGVACVVIVRYAHPMIERAAAALPFWACATMDAVFGLIFVFDLVATVIAVRELSDRLARITQAAQELRAISDELGQTIFDTTQTAQERARVGAAAVQTRGAGVWNQLEARQARIEQWLNAHRPHPDAAVESVRARFESAKQRVTRAMEEKGFDHRRLLAAFPNLKSLQYQESLEALREFYNRHRIKR